MRKFLLLLLFLTILFNVEMIKELEYLPINRGNFVYGYYLAPDYFMTYGTDDVYIVNKTGQVIRRIK